MYNKLHVNQPLSFKICGDFPPPPPSHSIILPFFHYIFSSNLFFVPLFHHSVILLFPYFTNLAIPLFQFSGFQGPPYLGGLEIFGVETVDLHIKIRKSPKIVFFISLSSGCIKLAILFMVTTGKYFGRYFPVPVAVLHHQTNHHHNGTSIFSTVFP